MNELSYMYRNLKIIYFKGGKMNKKIENLIKRVV